MRCAARAAAGTAGNDRDRAVALNGLGNVQAAEGNLSAASASYRASFLIRKHLTQADPGNTAWQRDLSVSHDRMGNVEALRGL